MTETEKKAPIPVIRVRNLYKIYRVGETKVRALNGVDFEIYKGEFVAIVGTSGSRQIHPFEYAGRTGEAHQRRDHHRKGSYGTVDGKTACGIQEGKGWIYFPVL